MDNAFVYKMSKLPSYIKEMSTEDFEKNKEKLAKAVEGLIDLLMQNENNNIVDK